MKTVKMKREKGFTLIEIIVVLVLLGVMGAFLATGVSTAITGYLFTRDAAIKSQKAQLALARISRELLDMTSIDSAPVSPYNVIAYSTSYGQFQIEKTGNLITLKKGTDAVQTLINDVSTDYGGDVFLSFTKQDGSAWAYVASDISTLYQIKVIIKLDGFGGTPTLNYETTINPRNNTLGNMPTIF